MSDVNDEDPHAGKEGDVEPAEETAGEELTLEGKLDRLSEIVGALEAQDLELDRALELFEEGVRHIREAEELLSRAELRVEELVGDGEEGRTRPLDEDRGGDGPEEAG